MAIARLRKLGLGSEGSVHPRYNHLITCSAKRRCRPKMRGGFHIFMDNQLVGGRTMGLFDREEVQERRERTLSTEEAFAGIMLAVMVADQNISELEIGFANITFARMEMYDKYEDVELETMTMKLMDSIEEHSAMWLLERAGGCLPEEWRATAFAVVVDLALADGVLHDKEEIMLDRAQEILAIEEDVAQKIVDVMLIKNKGGGKGSSEEIPARREVYEQPRDEGGADDGALEMTTDELIGVDLIRELGLDKLPKERQDKMIGEMSDAVMGRLNTRLITELSETDKGELERFLDTDGDIEVFFRSKLRDFDGITAEVIADFKNEMLGLQGVVRDARGSR